MQSLQLSPWLAVAPTVTCTPGHRDPGHYLAAVNQFGVQSNPRYTPNLPHIGDTYCNIFAWDVMRSMGVELPHWVNDAGDPVPPYKGHELTVNMTLDWMGLHGGRFGWASADAKAAELAARGGFPTVGMWRNPSGGHGHVVVVIPGPVGQLTVAQAGAVCFASARIEKAFPGSLLSTVKYFTAP